VEVPQEEEEEDGSAAAAVVVVVGVDDGIPTRNSWNWPFSVLTRR